MASGSQSSRRRRGALAGAGEVLGQRQALAAARPKRTASPRRSACRRTLQGRRRPQEPGQQVQRRGQPGQSSEVQASVVARSRSASRSCTSRRSAAPARRSEVERRRGSADHEVRAVVHVLAGCRVRVRRGAAAQDAAALEQRHLVPALLQRDGGGQAGEARRRPRRPSWAGVHARERRERRSRPAAAGESRSARRPERKRRARQRPRAGCGRSPPMISADAMRPPVLRGAAPRARRVVLARTLAPRSASSAAHSRTAAPGAKPAARAPPRHAETAAGPRAAGRAVRAPGVRRHVAQDVRELQGHAELDRVLARARTPVAEDLDRGQPHRGGDALAVRAQVGEGRDSARTRGPSGSPPRSARSRRAGSGNVRRRPPPARARARSSGCPAIARCASSSQPPSPASPSPSGLVHAVVHHAAERVERVDRPALRRGQDAERVVEVRAALAREARGEGLAEVRDSTQAAGPPAPGPPARRALASAPCCGRRRKTS